MVAGEEAPWPGPGPHPGGGAAAGILITTYRNKWTRFLSLISSDSITSKQALGMPRGEGRIGSADSCFACSCLSDSRDQFCLKKYHQNKLKYQLPSSFFFSLSLSLSLSLSQTLKLRNVTQPGSSFSLFHNPPTSPPRPQRSMILTSVLLSCDFQRKRHPSSSSSSSSFSSSHRVEETHLHFKPLPSS